MMDAKGLASGRRCEGFDRVPESTCLLPKALTRFWAGALMSPSSVSLAALGTASVRWPREFGILHGQVRSCDKGFHDCLGIFEAVGGYASVDVRVDEQHRHVSPMTSYFY